MKTAPVLSHLLLYFRLTWMQREWSYGVVTMVTDEGEDEKWHGAELSSTAPPPTQEEEVVDFCGEEQVPMLWPLQQGRDGDRI